MSRIERTFFINILLIPQDMKVSINTFRAAEFQLQTFFAHIVQFLKIAKNMIFKKLCLSPHLNCLSPHVAIGDKVGQRCS